MPNDLPDLDPLFHQPVRTRLIIALIRAGELSFSDLKAQLGVTDGNLDAHMKKLTGQGYIHSRMDSKGRPRTLYALSKTGEKAAGKYLNALSALIEQI